MLHTLKKWIYSGTDHGLEFNDIPVPAGSKSTIPDNLKPTKEMQDKFRRNCADMCIMKQVNL